MRRIDDDDECLLENTTIGQTRRKLEEDTSDGDWETGAV